jgi:hypothetical protein
VILEGDCVELLQERDELRAQVERLEAEVIVEHELNRQAMAEIEHLKLQTDWADMDKLRAEIERGRRGR